MLPQRRAPKTVLDFFKPKPNEQKEEKQSRKRSSSEALHKIQVNGGSAVKHIKLEEGKCF